MSTTVNVAGSSFSVPAEGDSNYGTELSNLIIQLSTSTKVLQNTSTSFPLGQGNLNFGTSFGLKAQYYLSQNANPSSTGVIRLGNNEGIGFRNQANSADLLLKVNSSNNLEFNSNTILDSTFSVVDANVSVSAAIALSKLATLTASRVLVSDGSGVISASSVTSTELGYVAGLTSSAVGATQSQTLTNKDIDGGSASNTSRITLPKSDLTSLQALTRKEGTVVFDTTSKKPYFDDGTNLKVIGSGSGGSVNFIIDGDAESSNIFSQYNDSSTTRPVDGTGGTVTNLSSSVSSTSPLIGSKSFLLSKTGSTSTQGQGWSVPFEIDSAYKAKILQIEFDFIVNSGTFTAGSRTTDSDVIVYIYDVTNSQLIEPSTIKLLSNSTTISDKFTSTFQTSATGTSYRLIFHIASSNSSDYELKVDNVTVKPCEYVFGTPITDWQTYTPTGSWTTNTTYSGRWRRVGDTLEAQINVGLAGAPNTADLTVNFLPPGLTVDTAKLATFSFGSVGDANIIDSGARIYVANPAYNGGSSVFLVHTESGNTGLVNQANPTTFTTSDNIRMNLRFPISGWSSSVQVSDSADTRVLTVRAAGSSSAVTGSLSKITYSTKSFDTHNAYSSGTFTCPTAGFYRVKAAVQLLYTSASNINNNINIYKNGVNYSTEQINQFGTTSNVYMSVSDTVECRAGDTIEIYASSSGSGITINDVGAVTNLSIERVTGPSAIAATEKVVARYMTNAAQVIGNGAGFVTVVFEDKDFDTHNAFNTGTGTYTIPVSGFYQINSAVKFNAEAYTQSNGVDLAVYKNGTIVSAGPRNSIAATATVSPGVGVSDIIHCNAGDTITIRVQNGRTSGNSTLRNLDYENYFSISKI